MIGPDDLKGELLFGLERMLLFGQGAPEEKRIVLRHQLVGNAHQFAEHVRRRLVDADEVAKALAHLFGAIQSLQDGKKKYHLLRLAFLLLKIAPDQNIEKLIGPAQARRRL